MGNKISESGSATLVSMNAKGVGKVGSTPFKTPKKPLKKGLMFLKYIYVLIR